MKNNYIIYKAKNTENGCVYIGATSVSLVKRRNDHIQKATKDYANKFQEAIRSYGKDAFDWEQVDTANNTDELAQKEKQFIIEYDSKNSGYNSDCGGGFQKTVYQYDIDDGSLFAKYDNLQNASNAVNATIKQISKTCLSVNQTYKNYYWSYEYESPFVNKKDLRKKTVKQFSFEDVFIKEYHSVTEASKCSGVNKTSIAKNCRGERYTAGGYKWKYE